MARVHFVKKARKDGPSHSGVKKGDSYYWWAFMVGGRGGPKHYSKTPPKPSQLTQSEFLGTMGDIEDEISSLSADDGLEDSVADIATRIRELGEEQQGKFDNMPEGLQQGDTGQLLEERANKCGEIADALEGIDFNDKPDESEDRSGEDESSAQSEDENNEEYWQGKLDEIQGVDLSV